MSRPQSAWLTIMWSRCDLDLWPFNFKTYSVNLCPQLRRSCKFGEIPTSDL